MKRLIVIVSIACSFLLIVHNSAISQTYSIKGKILDSRSGDPLIGANIISSTDKYISGIQGDFAIQLLRGDSLIVSYISYLDIKIYFDNLNEENLENFVVYMEQSNTILETATITGSKFEKRLSEATVSVEVIKPSLIKSTNTTNINSILDKVPGVQMIDGQANIRGGSGFSYGAGSRVMLLVDDMPALQTDAGFPNWGDIPIENISQVEILKGSASALYGSAALNGIINVRRQSVGLKPETEVVLGYTTFDDPEDPNKKWWSETPYGINASIVHRRKVDNVDLSGSLFFRKLESYNSDTRQNRKRLTFNAKYRHSDNMVIGLNTIFNNAESSDFFLWLNDTEGAFLPYPNNTSEKNNTRFMLDPFLTYYSKNGDKHKIQLRYLDISNDNSLNQSNFSQNWYGEYQYQKQLESIDLNLTGGGLISTTNSQSELFGDTTFTSRNAAAYLQLDKKITNGFSLSLGGRYEYNVHKSPSQFMGITIPDGKVSDGELIFRAGANYLFGKMTSVRASWGQGYRFPTITEKFITTEFGGFGIFPNVLLTPEQGWSSELGLKQGVNLLGYKGFLDIAGFWSEYDDMMEFSIAAVNGRVGFQSQNIGNTIIKGMEISTYGKAYIANIPINVYGGYTYIDPKYKDFSGLIQLGSSSEENVLKYRTKHNFKIDLEAEISDFRMGFSIQHTSHMLAIDAALGSLPGANINQYRESNNNGYRLFDARMAYDFDFFEVSILGNNLLNTEYTVRPALLEAPRNYSLRLDFNI